MIKIRPETREFVQRVADTDIDPATVSYLSLLVIGWTNAGWEDVYPYTDMPEWLRPKWYPADIAASIDAVLAPR